MTNIFPPVLEAQTPAIKYSVDGETRLKLSFALPQMNDISQINHVQVTIKYKNTGRPAVNPNYSPDGVTLFIPIHADYTFLYKYWESDLTTGLYSLLIPYKCFKNRRPEKDTTYSIQIRFGANKIWDAAYKNGINDIDIFGGASTIFTGYAAWKAKETSTLPSGFGEWSNITTVYCCGESLVKIDYNLFNFVPRIIFSYEPEYNDPVASCFVRYSYSDYSGYVSKTIVESGQNYSDGKFVLSTELNIAPVIMISVSVEATTVNNNVIGATITIPPIPGRNIADPLSVDNYSKTIIPWPGDLSECQEIKLLKEETEDGVLGKTVRIKSTSYPSSSGTTTVVGDVSVYRVNLFDFTTIKIGDGFPFENLATFSFKDYTAEMGEDYQYIFIVEVFGCATYQLIDVYPWGFSNPGYARLMKLDSIFLVDQGHQLKIEANTNVSAFKRNTSDIFQSTIGGQYPIYQRAAKINYRSFTFSGTITISSDLTATFFSNDSKNGLYWDSSLIILNRDLYKDYLISRSSVRVGSNSMTNEKILEYGTEEARDIRGPSSIYDEYYDRNIYSDLSQKLDDNVVFIERKFRDKVMEWVSNGKPKLFRTETEGNMIVMLSNISFAPQAKTGRVIYNIQATATEIDEYSMANLEKYNLIPKDINAQVISQFPRILSIGDSISEENYNALMFLNKDLEGNFIKAIMGEGYIVKDTTNLQEALDQITDFTFIRGKPQYPIYERIIYYGNSSIEVGDNPAGSNVEYPEDKILIDLKTAFETSGLFFSIPPGTESDWPERVILTSDGIVKILKTEAPQEVGVKNARYYTVMAKKNGEEFLFSFKMGKFYPKLSVNYVPDTIPIEEVKDTKQNILGHLVVNGGVPFQGSIDYAFSPLEIPYGLSVSEDGIISGKIAQKTDGGTIRVVVSDSIGNSCIWEQNYNQIKNWPVTNQLSDFVINYPEVGKTCEMNLTKGLIGESDFYLFELDSSSTLPNGLELICSDLVDNGMTFRGKVTKTDPSETDIAAIQRSISTPNNKDIVILTDSNREYTYDGSNWILLDGSAKVPMLNWKITGTYEQPTSDAERAARQCKINIKDLTLSDVWHTSLDLRFGAILDTFTFEGPDDFTVKIDGVDTTVHGIIIQGPEEMKDPSSTGLISIPLGMVLDEIDLNDTYEKAGSTNYFVKGGLPYYSGSNRYYKFKSVGLAPDFQVTTKGILKGYAQSGLEQIRIAKAVVIDARGEEKEMYIQIAPITTRIKYNVAPEDSTLYPPVELHIRQAISGSGKPFIDSDENYELNIPIFQPYLSGGYLKSGAGGYNFEILDKVRFDWLTIETTSDKKYAVLKQKSDKDRPSFSEITYVSIVISDNSDPIQTLVIQVALEPIIEKMRWESGATSEMLTLNVSTLGKEARAKVPRVTGGKPPYTISAETPEDIEGLSPFVIYQNENAENDPSNYIISGTPMDKDKTYSGTLILSDSSGQNIRFEVSGSAAAEPLDYRLSPTWATLYQNEVLIRAVSKIKISDGVQIFEGFNGIRFETGSPYKYSVIINGRNERFINLPGDEPQANGIKISEEGLLSGCPGQTSQGLVIGTGTSKVYVTDQVSTIEFPTGNQSKDEQHSWNMMRVVDKITPHNITVGRKREGEVFSTAPNRLFEGGFSISGGHPNLEWSCNGIAIDKADGKIRIKNGGLIIDSGLVLDLEQGYITSNFLSKNLENRELRITAIVQTSASRFLDAPYSETATLTFGEIATAVVIKNLTSGEGSTNFNYNLAKPALNLGDTLEFNIETNSGDYEIKGAGLTLKYSIDDPSITDWYIVEVNPTKHVLMHTLTAADFATPFEVKPIPIKVYDNQDSDNYAILNINYQGALTKLKFKPEYEAQPNIPSLPDGEGSYAVDLSKFEDAVEGGSGNYSYSLTGLDGTSEIAPYSIAFTPSGIIAGLLTDEKITASIPKPTRQAIFKVWDQEGKKEDAVTKTITVGAISASSI